MKIKSRIIKALAFLLLFLFLLYGCQKAPLSTSTNADFEAFTDDLFRAEVSSTTLGLHYTLENPEKFDINPSTITFGSFDTDKDAVLASLENCKASLESFSYHELSKENKATYDILLYHIEKTKEGLSFSLYEEPLNSVTGIQAQLPVLLAEYSFLCKEDVETYLNLIGTMPDYFNSLISFEKKKSSAGLFMSSSTADAIIEQCNAFLAMGEKNYLLSTFENRLENIPALTPKEKATFINQNKNLITSCVIPAYKNLVSALKDLRSTGLNQKGLCFFPKGKEYYSYLVSHSTGSSRTIEELNHLTMSQMADDLLAMQTLVSQNPKITEFSAAHFATSPAAVLKDLKEGITAAFPAPPSVKIKIKHVPKALQPHLSPAFYLIPAIDCTTPNVIYINEAHTTSDLNLFTTLAHEGYPGHLYQTTYFASTNPSPLRSLLDFEGYTEGWATYAEMCSYSISPLDKASASLLQKNSSLLLGMYASADIGIHYFGWSLEKVAEYFRKYGIEEQKTIQDIYDIIVADPGNYLKYYIGYVEILELKKKASFSQKDFHQKILEFGPAPFSILEKYVLS